MSPQTRKERMPSIDEQSLPYSVSLGLSTPRAISGSLPLDLRIQKDGSKIAPATLFAPTHLRSAERFIPKTTPVNKTLLENYEVTSSSTDPFTTKKSDLIDTQVISPDQDFIMHAEAMLTDGAADEMQSRFKANATDASYDFNEYIMLRNLDDPSSLGPISQNLNIPSDPRFQRFVDGARKYISMFVQTIPIKGYYKGPTGITGQPIIPINSLAAAIAEALYRWWFDVCALKAFNRFGRYSQSQIKNKTIIWGLSSTEEYYGYALYEWGLKNSVFEKSTIYIAINSFLVNGKGLEPLFTTAYWEDANNRAFAYFEEMGINLGGDYSPYGDDYPFEPYSPDEVLFGLRVVNRQNWRLLGYARGDLVKSIPLGPKESQKISVKIQRKRKSSKVDEQAFSFETTSENTSTTKDTSEVVDEATEKLNRHAEAEIGGGYGPFIQAKVSGGLSQDIGSSSKDTKTSLNETMEKAASRMKRDTKVTVSTEGEESFEDIRSSELVNPNDEIAVTYLYHRLQQRYWVSTEIAEVHSVVFVPEPMPSWGQISEEWVRHHGEIIARVLLEPSFAPVLSAIRKEPPNLSIKETPIFEAAANAGISAAKEFKDFKAGGDIPDLLASGPRAFEQHFERQNSLQMEQARRNHQLTELLTHIRRNILYYMRAIWASEDYDQRMQRYSRMRVPTEWTFVPRTPLPSGSSSPTHLEVDGIFMPILESARPLTEVINPIGPIGYLFNCAVYQLRDDPKLANLNQALAYLRSTYTRFSVTATPSSGAGVAVRHTVAYAPRSFSVDYSFIYSKKRNKWLIENPGLPEKDWTEVTLMPNGALDAFGLRIWLDGTPAEGDKLMIRVRVTGDLEDPHLRLVQMRYPLPEAGYETEVFTDRLLQEMAHILPELPSSEEKPLTWTALSETEKSMIRSNYHLFRLLKESGRLVTLDTANLVLDLEISRTPALEPFKRLHRYLDVMKEHQELQRRILENTRRERLLNKGVLGDPDIEQITLVEESKISKDIVAGLDNLDDDTPND